MTIPKKGSRKIIVDGKEYRYSVKPTEAGRRDGSKRLTIQANSTYGTYAWRYFDNAVTPSMVERFIREIIN
jgi:hypothetical protein